MKNTDAPKQITPKTITNSIYEMRQYVRTAPIEEYGKGWIRIMWRIADLLETLMKEDRIYFDLEEAS